MPRAGAESPPLITWPEGNAWLTRRLARPLGDPERSLPLTGGIVAAPAGAIPVYVSEAMVALYGAAPGTTLSLPLPDGRRNDVFVRAVWRDYARQYGAIVIDSTDWRRLTGDVDTTTIVSNTFETEWPPRSGRWACST